MKTNQLRKTAGLFCALWTVSLVALASAEELTPVKTPLQQPGLNKFNSSTQKPVQRPLQKPVQEKVQELPAPKPKPAVKIEKTGPAVGMLDADISYEITVTSTGDATVTDATVSDALPKGTTFVKASEGGEFEDGVVTWKLGDLKPKDKRFVQVTVTATEVGKIKNTATVRTTNTPPADASVETVVKGTPAIQIKKTGPPTAVLGKTISYEITATSTGNIPATEVTVSDSLPKGTAFVKASEGGEFKDGIVTWKLGDLKPKDKRVVQVTVTATEVGKIKNTATVRTTNTPSADASVETVVKGTPAIEIKKSGPPTALLGSTISYEITVRSTGNVPATEVAVSDALAKGTTFVKASEGGEFKDGVVTWKLGDLKPKDKRVVQVTVTATEVGKLKNMATVRTTNTPPADASVETVVKGTPAIQIKKTGPATALLGSTISYEITVTSTGNVPATEVTVSDALAKGTTFVKASEGGEFKDGVVTWKLGDLKPKDKRVVQVTVTATEVGKLKNTATVRTTNTPPADASVETVVKGTPAIKIKKTGPATRFLGTTISYELTVTSVGDVPVTDAVVSDPVPKGTTFVKASDKGEFKDGVVTWKLGNLKPKDTRVVKVTVKTMEIGTVKNTATVRTTNTPPADVTLETVVKGIPAILLEVVDKMDPIEVGEMVIYEIIVTNQGTAEGNNILIKATLPKELEFVLAKGPTEGKAEGQVVTYAPLDSLQPKAKAVWYLHATAVDEADIRFKLELTSAQSPEPILETESTNLFK